MRIPTEKYVRASLIDRLIDLDPKNTREVQPLRAYTPQTLRAAILRDLSWLLNTRCPISETEIQQRQRSVIDYGIPYGIPDFGTYYSNSAEDYNRLITMLEQTIAFYEPRLQNVHITVDTSYKVRHELRIRLEGEMVMNTTHEPISFPIVIEQKRGGEIKVGDE